MGQYHFQDPDQLKKAEDSEPAGNRAGLADEVWMMENVPGYPRDEQKIARFHASKKAARKASLDELENAGISGFQRPTK